MADGGPPTDGAPLHADEGATTDWRADWDAHAQRQRDRLGTTTPAQRLAWLEEALEFAASVGAMPRRPAPRPPRA
jgi:hypothetical protein